MNETKIAVSEAEFREETITTELLVEEGNYRVEIEGLELTEARNFTQSDSQALISAAETEAFAELERIDMVEFTFKPETQLVAIPLELLPPTATSASSTTTAGIPVRLKGEVARANTLEFELQRSRG